MIWYFAQLLIEVPAKNLGLNIEKIERKKFNSLENFYAEKKKRKNTCSATWYVV